MLTCFPFFQTATGFGSSELHMKILNLAWWIIYYTCVVFIPALLSLVETNHTKRFSPWWDSFGQEQLHWVLSLEVVLNNMIWPLSGPNQQFSNKWLLDSMSFLLSVKWWCVFNIIFQVYSSWVLLVYCSDYHHGY